jgi:hypothetical protein
LDVSIVSEFGIILFYWRFCPGVPGAGKSILTPIIVEERRHFDSLISHCTIDTNSNLYVLSREVLESGALRSGAAGAFGKENDTQIATMAWLSDRNTFKAYGSMVVYLSKASEVHRLLRKGFFYAGGESGYTKIFERSERPKQCYNCQEITNHRALQYDIPKRVWTVCQRRPWT